MWTANLQFAYCSILWQSHPLLSDKEREALGYLELCMVEELRKVATGLAKHAACCRPVHSPGLAVSLARVPWKAWVQARQLI